MKFQIYLKIKLITLNKGIFKKKYIMKKTQIKNNFEIFYLI